MLTYGCVALGGALGSVLRFGLSRWLSLFLGDMLPWGTIVINVGGSFAIGLFAAFFESRTPSAIPVEVRQFVLVGLCGGFTTFSSFSLQTLMLLNAGQPGRAAANIVLSVLLCLIGCSLGYMVPSAFAGAPQILSVR